MNKHNEPREFWDAAIAGGILFAVPIAGGFYRGWFGWMELVVAVVGVAALVAAWSR